MGRGRGAPRHPNAPQAPPGSRPPQQWVLCQGERAAEPPPARGNPAGHVELRRLLRDWLKTETCRTARSRRGAEGLGGGGLRGSLGQGVVQKPVGLRVVVKYRGGAVGAVPPERVQDEAGPGGHNWLPWCCPRTLLPAGAAAGTDPSPPPPPNPQQPRPLHSNLISPHRRLGGRPRRGRSCPPWPGVPGSPRPRARGGRSRR